MRIDHVTARELEGRAPPLVVALDEPRAVEVGRTGAKAANLARAADGGLATLPGVVLTTAFARRVDQGDRLADHPALTEAFMAAHGEDRRLVVRSSSVDEDAAGSSMAGQFESVVGVEGLAEFTSAVGEVLASRERAGVAHHPIAVLVQPLIEPACGGILFGVDPVTGRSDRRVITAVAGGPVDLVGGAVDGSRYLVDDRAKVLEFARNDGVELSRSDLSRLVALGDGVAAVFGGPQDVEWAIAADGTLWLLQSRPVTTVIRGVPEGPVYGPGPVAETFPEPLTELEADLWVPPLRSAVRATVLLTGAATRAELDRSRVVVVVGGRVAIDLRLAGEIGTEDTLAARVNPAASVRTIRRTWRLARLRAALPRLAGLVLDQADRDLEAVPPLEDLTSRQLLAVLHRSRAALHALHAHEILMGMLTDTGENRLTGASLALRILVEARREGRVDADIVRGSPAVLALTPPCIGPLPVLPPDPTAVDLADQAPDGNENGILREALRLRVRWVQELSARAAWALGGRLTASGVLPAPEAVRHLTFDHLEALVTKRAVVIAPPSGEPVTVAGEPLPAWFRLSDRGMPIRVLRAREVGGGTGAGGGIGTGPVTYDTEHPPTGSVLVTGTLTPGLGPILGRLNGLVAETGSVLSHLAILAREAGVATVVGYAGAGTDLPEGTVVTVDGLTGQVEHRRPAGEEAP